MNKTRWLALTLGLLLVACSGPKEASDNGHTPGRNGELRVREAPFIPGTTVAVSALHADLSPTGAVYYTTTTDELGQFKLDLPSEAPLRLEATGYYFNAARGDVSEASLTLRGLYQLSEGGEQSVFVNTITHLTAPRIEALVAQGVDFDAAIQQAEQELLTELAITSADYVPSGPGAGMNVFGDDSDDNAYALLVNVTLLRMGWLRSPSAITGGVQQCVNDISLDLVDGGLEPKLKYEIQAALHNVDAPFVTSVLARRELASGGDGVVPNVARVWDQDRGTCGGDSSQCAEGFQCLPTPALLVFYSDQLDSPHRNHYRFFWACRDPSQPVANLGVLAQCADLTQVHPELMGCRPSCVPGGEDACPDCIPAGVNHGGATVGYCSGCIPSECGEGLVCRAGGPGCGPGTACCQVVGRPGGQCAHDRTCVEGECREFTPHDLLCTDPGAEGQICDDGGCDEGLTCRRDQGAFSPTKACGAPELPNREGCCVREGGLGEYCRADLTCDDDLTCAYSGEEHRCTVSGAKPR